MLQQVRPDIPVLFLDTVHHFPQTLAYRDEIASKWGLNLITLRAAEPAPGLWQQDLKACCGKHKVRAAVRRARAPRHLVHRTSPRPVPDPRDARADRVVHAPDRHGASQGQPAGALAARRTSGRTPRRTRSLSCRSTNWATPASAASRARRSRLDPSNDRSGRWGGQKLECGIHLEKQ